MAGFRLKIIAVSSVLALSLTSCDLVPQLWPEKSLVDAAGPGVGSPPNCASCHAYPPDEGSHHYHLFSNDVSDKMAQKTGLNGPVTCLDCHQSAVAHFAVNGTYYRPLPYAPVDTTRGAALANEINALIATYVRKGQMAPWRTSSRHFDRHLDIEFTDNEVVPGHPVGSAFNPRTLTCSAVTCHESLSDSYRWTDEGGK